MTTESLSWWAEIRGCLCKSRSRNMEFKYWKTKLRQRLSDSADENGSRGGRERQISIINVIEYFSGGLCTYGFHKN